MSQAHLASWDDPGIIIDHVSVIPSHAPNNPSKKLNPNSSNAFPNLLLSVFRIICFRHTLTAIKEIKIDNETWTLDITIDIKLPGKVWYICRGTMDAKSALMAWIYKCATKAEHVFVVSFLENRIYEIRDYRQSLAKVCRKPWSELEGCRCFSKGFSRY